MKAGGEWYDSDTGKPEVADLFSTTLAIVDRDIGCLRAVAVPTKAAGAFDEFFGDLCGRLLRPARLGQRLAEER